MRKTERILRKLYKARLRALEFKYLDESRFDAKRLSWIDGRIDHFQTPETQAIVRSGAETLKKLNALRCKLEEIEQCLKK